MTPLGSFKNYWQESSGDYQNSPWTAMKNGGATASTTGQATIQPTGQTAPAQSAPASNANNDWVTIGGVNMPTFYKDDWEWKDYEYTPGGYAEGAGISGDGNATNEVYKEGGWLLTQKARDRLAAGGWTLDKPNNMAFNFYGNEGQASPEWTGHYRFSGSGGDDGIRFDKAATDADYAQLKAMDPMSMLNNAMYKMGDKWGQGIAYKREGDRLVPVSAGEHGWDSNLENRNRNKMVAKVAATVLSAGAAAPAMAAGMAAGGGILGSGLSLAQIGTAAGFLNTMSGGRIPGLSEVGMVAGLAGGVGGLADGVSNGINSADDAFNLAKTGYNVYSKGSQMWNGLTGEDPQQRQYAGGSPNWMARASQGGRSPYQMNQPYQEGGGDWTSFLDPMIRMGAGAYSEHQNRAAFTGLNDMFSRIDQQRNPYVQKLQQSYDDPNSYFQGADYQAMKRLEEDRLARGAAKTGRLANDVDRAALLQDHAAKNLAGYRQGLQASLDRFQLPYQTLHEAMRRKANAGGAAFGGVGYGGGAGAGGGLIEQIRRMVGGGGGGGFTPNVGGQGGYGQNIPQGDPGFESDFPPADPVYGNTVPTENWDWDNSDSWDFNGWFDDGGSFWGIE